MMPLTPKAHRCRNRRRHVDVVEMVKEMDENHNAKLEGERKQKNGNQSTNAGLRFKFMGIPKNYPTLCKKLVPESPAAQSQQIEMQRRYQHKHLKI